MITGSHEARGGSGAAEDEMRVRMMTEFEMLMDEIEGGVAAYVLTPAEMKQLADCLSAMTKLMRRALDDCKPWARRRRAEARALLEELQAAWSVLERVDFDKFGGVCLTGSEVSAEHMNTMSNALRLWEDYSGNPGRMVSIARKLELLVQIRDAMCLGARIGDPAARIAH
jgi:hypothetical protein